MPDMPDHACLESLLSARVHNHPWLDRSIGQFDGWLDYVPKVLWILYMTYYDIWQHHVKCSFFSSLVHQASLTFQEEDNNALLSFLASSAVGTRRVGRNGDRPIDPTINRPMRWRRCEEFHRTFEEEWTL